MTTAIISLCISALSVCISLYAIYLSRKTANKYNDITAALEEAFACSLTGDEPHLDVMDYPMGSKMWMVPCRDKTKED
jgi:hypothetical protein